MTPTRHGTMHVGVDMPVERRHPAGAEPLAQRGQRSPSRVAQHHIVIRESVRAHIGGPFRTVERRQGHGRVEIIEGADGTPGGDDEALGLGRVGAIGGDERDIGLIHRGLRDRRGPAPLGVEDQRAAREFVQVAVLRVEGQVPLEEGDVMPAARQRPHEAAPEGRVPVAP